MEILGFEVEIIEVLKWIAMFVLGGLSLWFKGSASAQGKIADIALWTQEVIESAIYLIDKAEVDFLDKTGEEKMNFVVDEIHAFLPETVQIFLTKDVIREIVQNVFDGMKEFVTIHLDKMVDNIEVDVEK